MARVGVEDEAEAEAFGAHLDALDALLVGFARCHYVTRREPSGSGQTDGGRSGRPHAEAARRSRSGPAWAIRRPRCAAPGRRRRPVSPQPCAQPRRPPSPIGPPADTAPARRTPCRCPYLLRWPSPDHGATKTTWSGRRWQYPPRLRPIVPSAVSETLAVLLLGATLVCAVVRPQGASGGGRGRTGGGPPPAARRPPPEPGPGRDEEPRCDDRIPRRRPRPGRALRPLRVVRVRREVDGGGRPRQPGQAARAGVRGREHGHRGAHARRNGRPAHSCRVRDGGAPASAREAARYACTHLANSASLLLPSRT